MAKRTRTPSSIQIKEAATGRRPPSPKELHRADHLQWQRERGDLDLSSFLLAIYFDAVSADDRAGFRRLCQQDYRVSGSTCAVLFALRRGGPPYVNDPRTFSRHCS